MSYNDNIPLQVYSRKYQRGVIVGWLASRDGEPYRLIKTRLDMHSHHMRNPAGWAFSVEHIEAFERCASERSTIELYTTSGHVYRTLFSTFQKHHTKLRVALKKGYETQLHLGDKWWKRSVADEPEPTLTEPEEQLVQTTMFGPTRTY